jgi:hypothetical protein
MENLFLFDGNPDRIEHFDLTYRKSIKDTSKSGEDNGYWYYLERLSLDRANGLFEFTQGVGGRNSATYIFRDAQDVAFLLNQFKLIPEDFKYYSSVTTEDLTTVYLYGESQDYVTNFTFSKNNIKVHIYGDRGWNKNEIELIVNNF